MIPVEHIRDWFEYEKAAHQKTVDSFGTVPETARPEQDFQKALDLFSHIMAARRLWLYRMGAISSLPEDLFRTGNSLTEVVQQMKEIHALWDSYLETLNALELRRAFEYTSTEGDRYRNSVEDVLVQLFGHSLYHRGQIAGIIRGLGGVPAATDFIYWKREVLL